MRTARPLTVVEGRGVLWPCPRGGGVCCDHVWGGGGVLWPCPGGRGVLWPCPGGGGCCDHVPGGGGGLWPGLGGGGCCDHVPWGEGGVVTMSWGGGERVLWPCPRGEWGVVTRSGGGGGCDHVHVPGGGGVVTSSRGRGCCDQVPGYNTLLPPPPPKYYRMTDACKNITFARFATQAVIISTCSINIFVFLRFPGAAVDYKDGFVGCMRAVMVNGKVMDCAEKWSEAKSHTESVLVSVVHNLNITGSSSKIY